MLKKIGFTIFIVLFFILCLVKLIQQNSPPPTITGSIDAYYSYNFSNAKDAEGNQLPTIIQALQILKIHLN